MFLPCRPCCGDGSDCFSIADRIVVTLSALPHENLAYNLLPVPSGWGRGLTYLDGYDGEYVLYKTNDQPATPGATGYTGECSYAYFDGYGTSVASGTPSFSITVKYRHGYNGFGDFIWDRTVSVYVLGGQIEWYDQGTTTPPSSAKTYTNADVTVNNSPEQQLVYPPGIYVPVPWTLASSTCSIADYDGVTHASAITPCECFNLPASLSISDTTYKATCLAYNGTADPGTDDYSSAYFPHGNCTPNNGSAYCSPIAATYTLSVGSITLKWWDYGTDELDLTISDMTLGGTTLPTAGTYTLPYGGLLGGSQSGAISCAGGGGYAREKVLGPTWAAAFSFTYSSTSYAVYLSVSLARSENDTTYGFPPSLIYPPERRLYVGASVISASGAVPGASIFWQSDGLQSEDTYGCGNMPTVTGGDGVSGSKYQLGCTGTAYQWTWSVSQA